ncbi:MAG: hypothetical protein HYW01_10280 [Deltaproteobacteria bacterium]|nr:hypothetical protein [Deltaproteobacteria bacterium]
MTDALFRIGKKGIHQNLDEFASYICSHLGRIGIKAAQKGITNIIMDSGRGVINCLYGLAIEVVKKKNEDVAVYSGQCLADIAIDAAQNNLLQIAENAATMLYTISHKAVKSKMKFATSLTYQLGRIGHETVEQGFEYPNFIPTHLSHLGADAADRGLEETSLEASNILCGMGRRAVEKGLKVALESITRCLEDVGKKSIENSLIETTRSVSNGLCEIAIMCNRQSLDAMSRRALVFFIGLGDRATLKNNEEIKRVIASQINEVERKVGADFVNIGFNYMPSYFSNRQDIQQVLTEFQQFYENEKSKL